jgi:Domain of unknown function (DUF4252)
VKRLALFLAAAALLAAQQFKFDLDRLAAKASNTVEISLNGSLLQLAARFLDSKDPDEAKVKKLIANLQGIYIRAFEFKKDAQWSPADLESVRSQLKAPEWSRIVGYKSTEEGENAEVYMRMENQKITGVAILAVEPREFTVVNIVGPVDLDTLADLSGHLDIPKLQSAPKK